MANYHELAAAALDPLRTDEIFSQNSELFAEVCARWISSGSNSVFKIAAFGRILPLAPHVAEHVERFLATCSQTPILGSQESDLSVSNLQKPDLLQLLLGTFRILSFDSIGISRYVRPLVLEGLLDHPDRTVRYIAVRTLCLYLHTADDATQDMIKRYIQEGEIEDRWEDQTIDYRFLSLWEEKRWSLLQQKLETRTSDTGTVSQAAKAGQLSPYTVNINGVLLPRLEGAPSRKTPSELISTPTTESNLRHVAEGLLDSRPILLTGIAGSGKTLLTRYFAWHLNKLDTMVTLHLNEQSDAKLLVGMYTTGAKPGTFSWRPGVLTTAVREGRWIFIEDLDRAPNEVISTLLPLIERGQLLIPSRGETVTAARGFRIIATMRSTLNPRGQEIAPRQNMIGMRFWNHVKVQMPQLDEFETILTEKYPTLQQHAPGLIRVYSRLLSLYSDAKFSSENGTSIRALTPRDLLKWSDRIASLLSQSSTFSAAKTDEIFMEAYDCFAGSLRSDQARLKVMACVAEELHIDPQRRDHLLENREVKLEAPSKSSTSGVLRIGRARLTRSKSQRRQMSNRPFSTNAYTLRLLEKVAVAVDHQEPLLLVGETGTGKTTTIQYLAEQLGRKMVAFNLSQQSESSDLLGGYKPVNVRSLVIPLKDEFDELFDMTFARKKNLPFLEMMGKRVAKGEWKRVCMLWRAALKRVDAERKSRESRTSSPDPDGGQPKKKRKVDGLPASFPSARWEKFAADLQDLEAQLASGSEAFAFSFLEGNIVKAVRNGDWILLDEINLASSDTLEALADLLGGGPDGTPSLLLTETGNVERIEAHPNFRVFAAMNPATDVGKKDLPPGIRSRFTELYVESPDSDIKSLRNIVEKYLGGDTIDAVLVKTASDVTNLYLDIQRLAKSNMLVDGADQKAHFSLRTLTRALSYAREISPLCTLRRALYEAFHMSFLTFLGKASEDLVAPLIKQHLFSQKSSAKTELGKPLQQANDGRTYVRQGHYWLRQGPHAVEEQLHYIITPFVQRNMNNLIRAASTRRFPVLIQGPTSSGKTSMIEYLAKRSGNQFVRINNHEHTDLQEYLGSYVSGTDGKLTFQEGILVRALREGHWIVLDELNLAPTDVLEALNRLLDDNRELLIPETQEVVRPHEDFMLFATQNPAGLYGGRKVLSRAFRNRFLELHFDDIPVEELTEILHRRTMIPESWCKRIVKVYQELSTLRQENRLFEDKSFATLRDLFRWAQRKADTIQDVATNGYLLLAERVRKEDERQAVKKIIESVMSKSGPRVQVEEEKLFSEESSPEIKFYKEKLGECEGVVWTQAMRRLFVLVAHAIRNNEPVLLVGETGCGKTTVCQMLADAFGKQLHIVNAHQNTETGDLIGAQRPIRNRSAIEELLRQQLLSVLANVTGSADLNANDLSQLLQDYDSLDQESRNAVPNEHREEIQINRVKAAALFEWADGSLVHAMKTGQYFLLDEISLADDSVLERLNSVLESSRTLLLAEKGPIDSVVTANEGFQFLATMNPGGDYGKRELSPALRNRFTEIWVPALSNVDDILQIIRSKLVENALPHADSIVSFARWFNDKYNTSAASSISIRDLLAWVTFINTSNHDDPIFGVVHGAAMVFIDTLGANPAGLLAIAPASINDERKACVNQLSVLLHQDISSLYFGEIDVASDETSFRLGSFAIPKFSQTASEEANFSLEASTTRSNTMRVVRALQLPKPILLEGNPGVGKTTLVTALAKAIGKPLTRLNLSEQTDLMDLFGSDVPVEGGQAGDWVLLDEMNLASQSVLEGLNAVLDHRGAVYISELDQTFQKHESFRVFAAQNPHHQGGGRKGLPASFVNRFTVVYADIFGPEDLALICTKIFPSIENDEISRLISFVAALDDHVVQKRAFGALGTPWEFNLRDTLRWLQVLGAQGSSRDFLDAIFVQRFRSETDRARLLELFERVYGQSRPRITLYHNLGPTSFQLGLGTLPRDPRVTRANHVSHLQVSQLAPMEALILSVQRSWPVILVGASGTGKTTLLDQLASYAGANLVTFSMNADIDAMDLVGGYEQADPSREIHRFVARLNRDVRRWLAGEFAKPEIRAQCLELLELLESSSDPSLDRIARHLGCIAQSPPEADTAGPLLKDLETISQIPNEIEGARFEWVDGTLIRALEQGEWLVLDNANLCSSAVLDRLNSLLEPNGYLSINEHSTADGEARIVYPHPNFRIFMTMDPRFGELSRAMRNRAVEICLLPDEETGHSLTREHLPIYPLDSQMYRFRHIMHSRDRTDDIKLERFESLSLADSNHLQAFVSQVEKGLISRTLKESDIDTDVQVSPRDASILVHNCSFLDLNSIAAFLKQRWSPRLQHLQDQLVANSNHEWQKSLTSLPYHPANDELRLNSSSHGPDLFLWFAWFYDNNADVYAMQKAIESIPSTKFERRREKQKLPAFLDAYWRILAAFLETTWKAYQSGEIDQAPLQSVRVLFWTFFELAKGHEFDRATFQTYLKLINESISTNSTDAGHMLDLKNSLSQQLMVFDADTRLRTGLSMERIWKHMRPRTARNTKQLKAILDLEVLADRFDAVMWKSTLKIDEMIQTRERFASALQLVRTQDIDASELLVNLEDFLQGIESSVGEDSAIITPYFENVFEGLCQYVDLRRSYVLAAEQNITDKVSIVRAKASLLARRSTQSFVVKHIDSPSEHLASLHHFTGHGKESAREMALQSRVHIATFQKLHELDELQLSQLDRFESELYILGQYVSLEANQMTEGQYNAQASSYQARLHELLATHSDILSSTALPIILKSDAQLSEQHRQLIESTLSHVTAVGNKSTLSEASQSWVKLALSGLALYVPNYPHDPALRPMVEQRLFNEKKATAVQKLESLRQFQNDFTGQNTSVRIRSIEAEIHEMGLEPTVPAIVRPEVSELDALQGEFSNLLSIIQPLLEGKMTISDASLDKTMRQNISLVIDRLSSSYRSYTDITSPAIGYLVCLNIGLSLGSLLEKEETNVSRSLQYITEHTPFFGLSGTQTEFKPDLLFTDSEKELQRLNHSIDLRWHTLQSLTITSIVEPIPIMDKRARALVHSIFQSFYSDWKVKLLKDQETEAKRSNLYTYKGDEQETDEADPELFPDYDAERETTDTSKSTSREHAIRVAHAHSNLFLGNVESAGALQSLLQWCAGEMVRVAEGNAHGTTYENALPTILLSLGDKADMMASSESGKLYNFYFDANISEAKRFINLVHRTQQRYRKIHTALEMDHATILDVLRTCDEALEFRHVDPVAKFITKVEKLHEYINAWQPLARRDLKTPEIFDEITKLLVSWRQLELTTWARLFDVEVETCRDHARSWFFVAYETIMAASESIGDQSDLNAHTKDLLKTLEGFFSSTTLGQFEGRIRLLEQFRAHAKMRMQDDEAFRSIHLALDNFIAYFSRFLTPVQEALSKGRQALEKEIGNVIKLASWKDTTIQALKQSAKTSHRKLTKLVRKFRAVLNRPFSTMYDAGFPEQKFALQQVSLFASEIKASPQSLQLCEASIPSWNDRPSRFKNVDTTTSLMQKLSRPSAESADGAVYIESFISDLETTMAELQKATPSVLTEENKQTVQHLKTRKRKLYADTMKELRLMGIVSNLSSNVLVKQDELSTVLAQLPTSSSDQKNRTGAAYFLHKSLSLMAPVRQVFKEHSGDLTSNDVAKSIGYLEGLLNAALRQRKQISHASDNLCVLQQLSSSVTNLLSSKIDTIMRVSPTQTTGLASLQSGISWLSTITKTGAKILAIQAQLGRTTEFDEVTSGLRRWSEQFGRMVTDNFQGLPQLPTNIWSETYTETYDLATEKLGEFHQLFNTWMAQYPLCRVVLKQIQPFVFEAPKNIESLTSTPSLDGISSLSTDLFAILDLVLGAMQEVQAALSELPNTVEDATWLVKEEKSLCSAIMALHTQQISKALKDLLNRVHDLGHESQIQAAAALFSAVQPVLEQYVSSHDFLIGKVGALHFSTSKLLYRLSRTFIQIGSQGFCTPSEKSNDQDKGKDDKLESGTGLGAGEGAEDISKDIEDDEDLEDLAQEKGEEREGSIEEEEDAVDMGEQEMEGELGDTAEKEEGDDEGEEGDDDVESQVGSVDDLGPNALDEKMWDEGGKDEDLDEKEGQQDVGTETQDEQVAADDKKEKKEDDKGENEEAKNEDEEMEMEGEEQDEEVGAGEQEKMDPFAKEEETLELPEELNLDGNDGGKEEEDFGDMDMDEGEDEELDADLNADPENAKDELESEPGEQDEETTDHIKDEDESKAEEEGEQDDQDAMEEDVVPLPDENAPPEDGREDRDDNVDASAEAGAGADANEDSHQDQKEQASASAANQQDGREGETSENMQETNAEDGKLGQTAQPEASGRGEDEEETAQTESFKKLGDTLERWYNQQRQIQESKQKDETEVQQIDKEVDMADADFEHLPDDETQADTQAMGTATEEQAKTLDQDMAMAVDEKEEEKVPARPEEDPVHEENQDVNMEDSVPQLEQEEEKEQQPPTADGRPQAFVGEQKTFEEDDDHEMEDAIPLDDEISETSSVHEVETQLELTHLDPGLSAMTPETARALWLHHESSTHTLSQQLTEHLRLILAPTLATKLRGDFRTGKRLNLKRIIPYIASGYKRDKIWLRRSMPSKRSYQVMIALDDSKSMAESGASNLALKTLTLVTRSLSMLEVGEVSVVGFGDQVNVTHDFDKPFTSESGVRVFEQFGFESGKTDVRKLVDRSLDLFAEARRKGASSAGEDLWQLMLVVSDGICDSHADIQRLVRRAQEERVMIVFIIIDATATTTISDPSASQGTGTQQGSTAEKAKDKTSILDLQSVEITAEGKVVRWKYMERFPFRYYLVVRDVRELPGVLAGALRQCSNDLESILKSALKQWKTSPLQRPYTADEVFFHKHLPKARKENPNLTDGEIARKLGQEWLTMDTLAFNDDWLPAQYTYTSIAYTLEKDWKSRRIQSSVREDDSDWPLIQAQWYCDDGTFDEGVRAPEMPKKAEEWYKRSLICEAIREQRRGSDATIAALGMRASREWRTLPDDKRAKFEEMARKQQQTYLNNWEEYGRAAGTKQVPQYILPCNITNGGKMRSKAMAEKLLGGRAKFPPELNPLQRSAYMMYYMDRICNAVIDNPQKSIVDHGYDLDKVWYGPWSLPQHHRQWASQEQDEPESAIMLRNSLHVQYKEKFEAAKSDFLRSWTEYWIAISKNLKDPDHPMERSYLWRLKTSDPFGAQYLFCWEMEFKWFAEAMINGMSPKFMPKCNDEWALMSKHSNGSNQQRQYEDLHREMLKRYEVAMGESWGDPIQEWQDSIGVKSEL
ncbi:P-loop containing nucleoside triphosphate hydrolase protein [Aaosphaeria arxii CBS 175.79]|uniref:Midasin n=1 Tax=Aaosphaeria arxii CBS 175.79 TaxID=1450172 RepID=A0A6A5XRI3_9PLEO|nr:P-loop containing nucleoside triphosphate hydrolase protein [Aaosphaeria arxii CBS 175.79]KAF2015300.1 P-loop containing nucleoside triphosphate hydrolase protein [Aaosphaeria arxii CBS 175.79]